MRQAQATGWLVSFLLHGSMVLAALSFVQRIQLQPEPTPFSWNVAMVDDQPVEPHPVSEPSLAQPTPSVQSSPPPAPRSATASQKPNIVRSPIPIPLKEAAKPPPAPPKEPVHEHSAPAPPLPVPHEMITAEERQPSAAPPPFAPALKESPTPMVSPRPQTSTPAPSMSSPQIGSHPPQSASPVISEASDSAPRDAAPSQPTTSDAPSSPAGPLVAAIPPAAPPTARKPNYGWLADLMAQWIQDLDKRYPAMLRTEGVQGKVTLTAVLHQDGTLSDVRVAKSSGHAMLDQVALEDVRKGRPIQLSRPLDTPQMPVKFSIIYDLRSAQ